MLLLKIDSSECLCAAAVLTWAFIYLGVVYSSEDSVRAAIRVPPCHFPLLLEPCLPASAASVHTSNSTIATVSS